MTKWIFCGNVTLEHADKFYKFVKDREYEVTEVDTDMEVRLNDNKSILLDRVDFEKYFIKVLVKTSANNGGTTNYYQFPAGTEQLQDLIEYRNMNFSIGNIFKACYRLGECEHSEMERDLNKIIWFAQRELERLKKKI